MTDKYETLKEWRGNANTTGNRYLHNACDAVERLVAERDNLKATNNTLDEMYNSLARDYAGLKAERDALIQQLADMHTRALDSENDAALAEALLPQLTKERDRLAAKLSAREKCKNPMCQPYRDATGELVLPLCKCHGAQSQDAQRYDGELPPLPPQSEARPRIGESTLDGYELEVYIERGYGCVYLRNPSYDVKEFSDTVDGLSHCITKAIDHAKETP